MRHFRLKQILPLCLISAVLLMGCDYSAKRDLRRAEKALKQADAWHAEHFAEREYRKAQALFVEAMDLAKVRYINEARDKAAEAKSWAEEAAALSETRFKELQEEKDRVGEYKN